MTVKLNREPMRRRFVEGDDNNPHPNRLNDAEYDAQCERIRSKLHALIPIMGLSLYSARLVFEPGEIDCDGVGMMSVESNWFYRWVKFTASVPHCAEVDDDELTYSILHEGAHCFLELVRPEDPTEDQRNLEELAATCLGKMAANGIAYGRAEAEDELAEVIAERDDRIVRLEARVAELEAQVSGCDMPNKVVALRGEEAA